MIVMKNNCIFPLHLDYRGNTIVIKRKGKAQTSPPESDTGRESPRRIP